MLPIIKRAAIIVGGMTLLAKKIGAPRTALYGWDRIPGKYCLKLSKETGLELFRLRPDLYPKGMKVEN